MLFRNFRYCLSPPYQTYVWYIGKVWYDKRSRFQINISLKTRSGMFDNPQYRWIHYTVARYGDIDSDGDVEYQAVINDEDYSYQKFRTHNSKRNRYGDNVPSLIKYRLKRLLEWIIK